MTPTSAREFLRKFCGHPRPSSNVVEPWVLDELRQYIDTDDATLKAKLHELLDACVHGALANSFVITCLDVVWQSAFGGKPDDPAPWREKQDPRDRT